MAPRLCSSRSAQRLARVDDDLGGRGDQVEPHRLRRGALVQLVREPERVGSRRPRAGSRAPGRSRRRRRSGGATTTPGPARTASSSGEKTKEFTTAFGRSSGSSVESVYETSGASSRRSSSRRLGSAGAVFGSQACQKLSPVTASCSLRRLGRRSRLRRGRRRRRGRRVHDLDAAVVVLEASDVVARDDERAVAVWSRTRRGRRADDAAAQPIAVDEGDDVGAGRGREREQEQDDRRTHQTLVGRSG